MNVMNDQSNIDYVNYFTNQLPKDLAAMAALRDELAKRQGALTAVEDANRLKAQAKEILDSAKAEAAKLEESNRLGAIDLEKKLSAAKKDKESFNAEMLKAQNDFANKQKELIAKENDLAKQESSLADAKKQFKIESEKLQSEKLKIAEDRKTLDALIKSFQEKVSGINV